MKANFGRLAALLLMMIGTQVSASDQELCQAGYPVMLMTDSECKAYIATRTSLQKRGNLAALKLLDARMQDELVERAMACPCAAEDKVNMAMSSDGC